MDPSECASHGRGVADTLHTIMVGWSTPVSAFLGQVMEPNARTGTSTYSIIPALLSSNKETCSIYISNSYQRLGSPSYILTHFRLSGAERIVAWMVTIPQETRPGLAGLHAVLHMNFGGDSRGVMPEYLPLGYRKGQPRSDF